MASGLDRPSAGGFAARIASRLFDGMTQRYLKDEQLGREKDLLAQRGEQTSAAIGDRAEAEKEMLGIRSAFQTRDREAGQDYDREQAEWMLGEKERVSKESAEQAKTDKIEFEKLKAALGFGSYGDNKKTQTQGQAMLELKRVYPEGELDPGVMREASSLMLKDVSAEDAVRVAVGNKKADALLLNFKPHLAQFKRSASEKFIDGGDIMQALASNGVGHAIAGLSDEVTYSVEELMLMLAMSNEDPLRPDLQSQEIAEQTIYSLLATGYTQMGPELPTEQAFHRGASKILSGGNPVTPPRLP